MPLFSHEVTTHLPEVKQRMSDYLKEIPDVAPRADMLASKVVTFVSQNPAIRNTINFAIEINQNEAFNDISPQEREVLVKNAPGLARVAINRFNPATASFAFNITENLPLVQGNAAAFLSANPNIGRDGAEIGARAVTKIVSQKPEVAWNFDTLRAGIRENPNLPEGLKAELTREGVVEAMVYTAAQPFNSGVGAMPAMFDAYPAESTKAAAEVLQSMPSVEFDTPNRILVAAAALGRIAVRPEGFSRITLESDLMKEGLTADEAKQLPIETIEYIATGVAQQLQRSNKDLSLEFAGWAAVALRNPDVVERQLSAEFAKVPGIGDRATLVAKRLVQNPALLVSSSNMERALASDKNIPPAVVSSAISPRGKDAFRAGMRSAFDERQALQQDPGGIDINPAFLKLLVKRDGKGIPIPTAKVPVKDTDIYGFEPVISNVEKVDDLPAFIGIEE